MFSEAHRVLTSRGTLSGITGAGAELGEIREALQAVGFKNIKVGYGLEGAIGFSAVKP